MTVEHYASTTTRIMNDDAKYFIYPLFKTLALAVFKDRFKADMVAGVATTGFYSMLSNKFAALETGTFDNNVRAAVAAEMGKKPTEVNFSDYRDSHNCIVTKRMELFDHLGPLRRMTDLLPMLPVAIQYAAMSIPGLKGHYMAARKGPPVDAPAIQHIMNGYNVWDCSVYAGKAAYWLYETFSIQKTAHYDIHKINENKEDVKRMIDANDLIGVVNRSYHDRNEPMITSKKERNELWPVLEKLSEKMNNNEAFNTPELVYLVGMDKLNIFKKDAKGHFVRDAQGGRIVDQAEKAKAFAEIEKMDKIGLKGISEENRQKRAVNDNSMEKQSFADRVQRNLTDGKFNFYQSMFNKHRDRPTEFISGRDMGEVPGFVP